MQRSISINYPKSLAFSLKMNTVEFQNKIKTLLLIKLYELGKVLSGFASNLLKISRIDFLELLGKYNVSYFYDEENDLESNFKNA